MNKIEYIGLNIITYKGLNDIYVDLSSKYKNKKGNYINEEKDGYFIFDNSNTFHVIVGKNGTGKSSILEVITKINLLFSSLKNGKSQNEVFEIFYTGNEVFLEYLCDGVKKILTITRGANFLIITIDKLIFKILKNEYNSANKKYITLFNDDLPEKSFVKTYNKFCDYIGVVNFPIVVYTSSTPFEGKDIKQTPKFNDYSFDLLNNKYIYNGTLYNNTYWNNSLCKGDNKLIIDLFKDSRDNGSLIIDIFNKVFSNKRIELTHIKLLPQKSGLSIKEKNKNIANRRMELYNYFTNNNIFSKINIKNNLSGINEISFYKNISKSLSKKNNINDTEISRIILSTIGKKEGVTLNISELNININKFYDKNDVTSSDIHISKIDLNNINADDFELFFYVGVLDSISFNDLSGGEKSMILIIAKINYLLKLISQFDGNNILLLDEPDIALHPEWSRLYIYIVNQLLKKNGIKDLKTIITTHSPIMLSDLPHEYVIPLYMDNSDPDYNQILVQTEIKKTFLNNLYGLYSSPFFVTSALGEFAKEKFIEFNKDKETRSIINTIIGDDFIINNVI